MGGKESKNSLQPQLVEATYIWQVESYSKISIAKPKLSSVFEVHGDSYQFELHKDANLEVKLHQKKSSDSPKKFRCVSAFLDHRGIQHYFRTKEVEIGKRMDTTVLLSIPLTVFENEVSDIILMDGFSIGFKISDMNNYSETPDLNSDTEAGEVECNSHTETLSCDLGKLYSSQTDSDIEVRTNTDRYFRAHRLILCARSPVFAAMFRHDTSESTKGVIEITDIEVPILSSLFHYIYRGKVNGLNSNTAAQLTMAADKYDLLELRDICLKFLLSNLTMDNICDSVVLCEMCDTPSLKKEVCAFMSKHTTEVIQSDKWKALQDQYPDIANSTLASLLVSAKTTE